MIRSPINCDPAAGPACIPGNRRLKKSDVTAIDLFAGAGGFTTGAEAAGVKVSWAINHFKEAIATHAVNHPGTEHCCEDVFQFDWSKAPLSDLILASPSCKCHSTAATGGIRSTGRRGTAPHHDRLRATPEAVIQAAYVAYYESLGAGRNQPVVVIENVPDFKKWLLYDLHVVASLERMGYSVSEYVLDAADFGVPQRRKRLFLIAVPGKRKFDLKPPRKKAAKGIGSILLKEGTKGQPWVPLEDYGSSGVIKKAHEQVKRAEKLSSRPLDYWAWTYTTGTNPILPDQPFRTLTAALGSQSYVMKSRGSKHWIRQISPQELKAIMGFPKSYKVPDSPSLAGTLMGNAVCPPVAEFVIRQIVERA